MSYPDQFGHPCWTLHQVSKVIPAAATAQTSEASIPYFLAAHSPFSRITDLKATGHMLTEEDVFHEIFSPAKEQVEAFVTGEPGTGKSHLIRWLRLRAEYAAQNHEASLDKFKLVLVSRGTGSLKDALTQIVDQLGTHFQKHLTRVQSAIERISDSTARATLLAELALEVGPRWEHERHRDRLPRELTHLSQALRAEGFGAWFKRDGGVIHQVIQRLTEPSSVEDRESFPSFQPDDFIVPERHLDLQHNSKDVYYFAENLQEEPGTRQAAAEVMNKALKDAIGGLTGLRGSDLLEVFMQIRREIGPKKSLAVFIEDVSATSGGLDIDVINALEPRAGDGLCRMVAILGIVDSGWNQLQKNQKDRGTHIYQVGGLTANSWAESPQEVAQFTARYLNAVRSSDDEVKDIASGFFAADSWRSKCDGCPHKRPCHVTFGKITLSEGVDVGTFPYTAKAPQSLLIHLAETRYRSQRGLLTRVLLPVLDQSFKALSSSGFPRPALFGVQNTGFPVWGGFTNTYCSGAQWDEEKRLRLRFIAQFWISPGSAEQLADQLQPLLEPLGFPKFSRGVSPPPPRALKLVIQQWQAGTPPASADFARWPGLHSVPPLLDSWRTGHPQRTGDTPLNDADLKNELESLGVLIGGAPPPPPPPPPPELARLLSLLDSWHAGQPLQQDNKFRELLAECLAKSIVWEDHRATPIAEKKRLINKLGSRFPRIEAQTMKPGGTYFFFDFARNTATFNLLQSLLHLKHAPGNSWAFPHGEFHKRELCRWLRKNTPKVIASIQPEPPSLTEKVLRAAIEALAIVAFLRDRRKLPAEKTERIRALFAPVWQPTGKPVILSSELQAIADDLEQKHIDLRNLIIQELGCGQGDADPKDFLDPVPILKALEQFEQQLEFHSPPPEPEQATYWAPRFLPARSLTKGAFAAIPKRIQQEREAIAKAFEVALAFITKAGFGDLDLQEDFERCLALLIEVIGLQQGSQQHRRAILPLPNDLFEQLWKRKLIQTADVRAAWTTAILKARELSQQTDNAALLAFDPTRLKEVVDSLKIIEEHLNRIDKYLNEEEQQDGDSGDSRPKLLDALKQIEDLPDSKNDSNS